MTPWSSRMVATPCSRVTLVNVASRSAMVRVAAKLAVVSVLDESERQVFGVIEVIEDLVVAARREELVEALRVAMRKDFRTSSMERLPM